MRQILALLIAAASGLTLHARVQACQRLPRPIAADPDEDGDGLSDFQERHKYRTDPAVPDSDGDGTPDGDWDERREFAYTVRTVVRVLRPVDVSAANDDYQDARLRAETPAWVELEVIHYPLGTAGDAIEADPAWRASARRFEPYLASTTTSSWDAGMREALLAELRAAGRDPEADDDRTLAVAAARRLMERSRFEDGFTTFLADFEGGKPVVPPRLEGVVRTFEEERGIAIEEQWKRELLATGMFANRVHGSCTSSAIYLCGGLRAAGIPARIVLLIPLVDANDPRQLAMVEQGIRHHRVRATALKGLRGIAGSWASHTFNEVFVGGRWRRLNYTRLGQPILDEGLYGMTTHVLTVRDWADARMGRTVGERQALGPRDDVFRTANPYRALEVSDAFGVHAEIPNPEVPDPALTAPEPLAAVAIDRVFWLASDERPAHLNVTRVDMDSDRTHIVLQASTDGVTLQRDTLDPFWRAVPKGYDLVSEGGRRVPAAAVRGMWWGTADDVPYLYFLLRVTDEDRARLAAGERYGVVPRAPEEGPRFTASEGLGVVVPR